MPAAGARCRLPYGICTRIAADGQNAVVRESINDMSAEDPLDCPLGPYACQHPTTLLRESERRYRKTFESAAVGIAHYDPDGNLRWVNQRVADILGYSREELRDLNWQEYTHPHDLARDRQALQEAHEGRRDTYQVDKRYIRKDGTVIWSNTTVGTVRAETGEVEYFISVIQDITEQKRMLTALSESEARFRAFQQTSPDGLLIYRAVRDNHGEIVDFICDYANPAAAFYASLREDQMIGARMLDATPCYTDTGLFEVFREVVETGIMTQTEIEISLFAGGTGWFRYSAVKLDDGVAISFADIYDQKKAELRLRQSEARFRAVQQTSPDGFVMYASVRDAAGEIVDFRCEYANPAAAEFSRMRVNEMVGARLLEKSPLHKESGLFDVYRGVVETGKVAKGEIALPFLPDEDGWLSYSAVKVDDGFAVSFSDITARKKTELALKESEARLRGFQQTAPDGFMSYKSIRDRAGRIKDFLIEYTNPAAEQIIGRPKSELIGRTMSEVMVANFSIGAFERYVEVVESGEPWQGELLYPRPTGDQWFRATAAKVGDGFAVSFGDVTQRKLQEHLLRESDQRLRSILDNVVAFVGLLSPEGILLEVNELALASAGLERSDVIGKPFWETYWWSHDVATRDQLRDSISDAAKGERVRYDMVIRTAGDNRMSVDFQLAPILDENGWVTNIVPSGIDISDRKRAEQHREMLLKELSHRVKNSLATVQTIASHTLREATDLESFREAFVGRLMAISKCHDLLVDTTRRNADFSQLVRDQVMPYARAGATSQVAISGPSITLGAEASHAFGLVLHELATNAAKYGALSTGDGHLDISWKNGPDPTRPEAIVEWRESGGPPVSPPTRRGFGSVLIEQSLAYSLGGGAEIDYRPEGLYARFRFPKKDRT